MKITTIITVLASAAAAAGAIGIVSAPIVSAEDTSVSSLGSQGKLVDGNVIQGWTISNLQPSSDEIPYPVSGTLWEATATDEAIQGGVTPIVSNLNARAQSGQTYRALFQVPTTEGVNPATLVQGEKTTGKVYFDVTGDNPDSVVYNAGGSDLLSWIQPAPAPARQSGSQWSPAPARSQATPAPAGTAAAAPATTPVTPAPGAMSAPGAPLPAATETVPGAPLPAGSQGTPLPAGSQGTPLPAGSQGTPLAPASSGGAPLTTTTLAPPPPAA